LRCNDLGGTIEHMFDYLRRTRALSGLGVQVHADDPVAVWGEGCDRLGDHLSAAELAAFWASLDAEPVVDTVDVDVQEEPPGYSVADVEPSGWLALELDSGTADPAVLPTRT
jgi:hypothetical protein